MNVLKNNQFHRNNNLQKMYKNCTHKEPFNIKKQNKILQYKIDAQMFFNKNCFPEIIYRKFKKIIIMKSNLI